LKFYEVKNNNYSVGFYHVLKNALIAANEINSLIKKYEADGVKGVDLTPVRVVEIETMDK
jgi:hypothetical protein